MVSSLPQSQSTSDELAVFNAMNDGIPLLTFPEVKVVKHSQFGSPGGDSFGFIDPTMAGG